jgi:hypothetical protein
MSGDDYHTDWPLVMWAVNHFSSQIGSEITLTGQVQDDKYSKYPTWFFKKQQTFNLNDAPLDPRLMKIAAKERARIHKLRTSPIRILKRRVVGFIKHSILSR